MAMARVNEIDLMRFFAALAVVLFHYAFRGYAADSMSMMPYPELAPFAKYGYLGVELFFMISGFVILMTAASGSLRGFVISRVVRLYPAFWACCTVTFLVTLLIGGPRFTASFSQYLVNMSMLSEYFDVRSIDGVYWSLFIEVRFYVMVGIILALGLIRHAQAFLLLWLLASIVLEVFPQGHLRYLLLVDYSAYFISGALFYLVWSQGASVLRYLALLASWALAVHGSLARIPALEAHYATVMSRELTTLIIAIFFVLFVLVVHRKTGFIGRRPWVLAGVLTYPLYLLHQNIGYMLFNQLHASVNHHLLLWGVLAIMLVASYLVHILIEKRYARPMKSWLESVFSWATMMFARVRRS